MYMNLWIQNMHLLHACPLSKYISINVKLMYSAMSCSVCVIQPKLQNCIVICTCTVCGLCMSLCVDVLYVCLCPSVCLRWLTGVRLCHAASSVCVTTCVCLFACIRVSSWLSTERKFSRRYLSSAIWTVVVVAVQWTMVSSCHAHHLNHSLLMSSNS